MAPYFVFRPYYDSDVICETLRLSRERQDWKDALAASGIPVQQWPQQPDGAGDAWKRKVNAPVRQ